MGGSCSLQRPARPSQVFDGSARKVFQRIPPVLHIHKDKAMRCRYILEEAVRSSCIAAPTSFRVLYPRSCSPVPRLEPRARSSPGKYDGNCWESSCSNMRGVGCRTQIEQLPTTDQGFMLCSTLWILSQDRAFDSPRYIASPPDGILLLLNLAMTRTQNRYVRQYQ